MQVSNDVGHWFKNFQEFKIEVTKEFSRYHTVTIAMLIFSIIGIAVVCVWSARKVLLSKGVKEQKINQTGLKALKIPASNDLDKVSPQQNAPPIHTQKPRPIPENPWALTATHIAALALGTIGLMALYYASVGSTAQASTVIPAAPILSKTLPLQTISDVAVNSLNVTNGQCPALKLPWTSSVCTSPVPYSKINLFSPPSNSFTSIIISMGSALIEKGECTIRNITNRSSIRIDVTNILTKNAINLSGILKPIPNTIPKISDFLMGSVTAIFFGSLFVASCCKLTAGRILRKNKINPLQYPENQLMAIYNTPLKSKRKLPFEPSYAFLGKNLNANSQEITKTRTFPKLKITPLQSMEKQLMIVQNKDVKFKQILPSKINLLYNCLGVDFNDYDAMDNSELFANENEQEIERQKIYNSILAWVAIGCAKLELIQNFNNLTPKGLEKLKFTASFEEIGKQYKRLSLKLHSDLGNDGELFKDLGLHWKTNFVEKITKIYREKLEDENALFSNNTDHLIELDEKMKLQQACCEKVYQPSKIRMLITKALSELSVEESSSEDEDIAYNYIELDFLRSSLISALNTLTPVTTKELSEAASFQEIGLHYQHLQKLSKNDEKSLGLLKECWKNDFIEEINEIYKSENSNLDKEIDVDFAELIDLDSILLKSKRKMNNSSPTENDSEDDDFFSDESDAISGDDSI